MKKILLSLAVAAMSLGAVQAKDLNDMRIYINPGHGGWGSGDRHMGTIGHGDADYTDTCGFFETNTNLWKGLATLQLLADYGFKYDPTLNQKPEGAEEELYRWGAARDMSQGLVMSHVKNGVSRNINEIAEEVEMNNFDYFISIHSNAHVDGTVTNYPAMFVRGENGTQSVPGSVEALRVIWPYAYSNEHSCWSNYSMSNPALYYDIDFWGGDHVIVTHPNGQTYKGYYAVLRHGVPGMLCEGYFHTYQPARHRAMNPDVCAIEGEAYARGIAEYYNVPQENTGDLYGIVRDLHERFRHKYYNASASSPDAYKPLNGAVVTLYDEAGNVVATKTTDNEWNGAFVFRKLTPGQYTISVSCEGYKDAEAEYCGPFTVEAAKVVYPRVFLESLTYEPPAVQYTDYPDEIDTPAILAADSYNFNLAVDNKEIPALEGKSVKRMVQNGGRIYVLAHDEALLPTVVVLDGNTLEVIAEVSTVGTVGNLSPLADIGVTADGVLIGSSAQHCVLLDDELEPGEVKGFCNVYRWENNEEGVPTGDPIKWFQTGATANFYSAYTGFTFAYTGTFQEGTFYMPSYSTYYNRKVWLNRLEVAEGEFATASFVNDSRDHMNMDELGEDVTIALSPVTPGSFIVNSSKVPAMQFNGITYNLESTSAQAPVNRDGYFKYAGSSMMVYSDLDAEGKNAGVRMSNISNGLADQSDIQTANTAMEAADVPYATTGRTVVLRNQDDEITGAYIDLYALRGNKISRFTTRNVEQPTVRPNWAYGLNVNSENDMYTLTFSLTDAAHAAIRLVPAEGNEEGEMMMIAEGDYAKGENTVTVDPNELTGLYTWEVVVFNPTVPSASMIFNSGVVSSGVTIDLNPDNASFGTAYVSQKDGQRGIRAFTPALEAINDTPWLPGIWDTSVGASPWRLATMENGNLLISDWGDKQGGLYLFDPVAQSGMTNFFAGTIRPSSGEWTYEGKVIGGSTSGMALTGKGEDTKLISFQEDWPSDYSLNLVTYNIGTATQITEQPEQSDEFKNLSGLLINGNVDVVLAPQGMALGQVRGSGNNNKAVPVFIIADGEGNLLYNSGEWDDLGGGVGCIALSEDGNTFFVQDAAGNIRVCALTWEPEFTLTELYKFPVLSGGDTDYNSYQAALDPAGNLYVANRSSFRVFSLPREASEAVTPAASSAVLNGTGTGIEGIRVENNDNAPVEYYNLQGIRMNGNNLPAGVYIRRQGTTSTKVVR